MSKIVRKTRSQSTISATSTSAKKDSDVTLDKDTIRQLKDELKQSQNTIKELNHNLQCKHSEIETLLAEADHNSQEFDINCKLIATLKKQIASEKQINDDQKQEILRLKEVIEENKEERNYNDSTFNNTPTAFMIKELEMEKQLLEKQLKTKKVKRIEISNKSTQTKRSEKHNSINGMQIKCPYETPLVCNNDCSSPQQPSVEHSASLKLKDLEARRETDISNKAATIDTSLTLQCNKSDIKKKIFFCGDENARNMGYLYNMYSQNNYEVMCISKPNAELKDIVKDVLSQQLREDDIVVLMTCCAHNNTGPLDIKSMQTVTDFITRNKSKLIATSLIYTSSKCGNEAAYKINRNIHRLTLYHPGMYYLDLNNYKKSCFTINSSLSYIGKRKVISEIESLNYSIAGSALKWLNTENPNDSTNTDVEAAFLE